MEKIGDYLEFHALELAVDNAPTAARPDRAVIRTAVLVSTPVKVLYMASLELDGMEMIESFRITVSPDTPLLPLPEIYIFNPIRSAEPGRGEYTVMLKIYASGGRVHQYSGTVRFPPEPRD